MDTALDGIEIRPARNYSAPTDLGIVSAYFNPRGYRTKTAALHRYLQSIRRSGIPLVLVEGAFGSNDFLLPASTNVVQVRCRDVMWQKERLLNLALQYLPATCEKVAWLDADILFSNPNWAKETSELLDTYPVVQPFEMALWLPKGPARFRGRGLAWPSYAKVFMERPTEYRNGDFDTHGHCGYAWAARRSLLEAHGLFDKSIAGGGDHLMAHAMGGDFSSNCVQKMVGRKNPFSRCFEGWGKRFHQDVHSQIASVPGHLFHLWHGDKVKRRYSERSRELLDIRFNPTRDLRIGNTGAWEWASRRPELHAWAADYFSRREEDATPEDDYRLPESVLREIASGKLGKGHGGKVPVSRKTPTHVLRQMARSEDWY